MIVQAFFARVADGGGEAAEVFEAGFVFAAAERVAAAFFAGAFLRDEGFDVEAELLQVAQHGVDRADFVQFDDAEAGALFFGFGDAGASPLALGALRLGRRGR